MLRVIEADTVVVRDSSHEFAVRLLNVDAPESHPARVPAECLASEATKATEELLPVDTPVKLAYDAEHAALSGGSGCVKRAEDREVGFSDPKRGCSPDA